MKTFDRSLGLGAVIAISVSSMLGVGVFVLPGLAFEQTGASAWLAFLVASVCILPAALSKSELATAMPTSGGAYVYLERTFGPLFGTIAGLGLWLALLLKSAFALFGIGAYLSTMSSVQIPVDQLNLYIKYLALILLFAIVTLNILGIGKLSKTIIGIVVLSVVTLTILAIFGTLQFEAYLFEPYYSHGISGFFMATALAFISYSGVTKVAAIAGEIKDPEVNLPRGILISLVLVTTIYCSIAFVLAGNLPQAVLNGNLRPIHTLAQSLGGNVIGVLVSIVAIITLASMANAGILAGSRFPFAMSRDRLLPHFLGLLNSRFVTPLWSIILSGSVVAGAILFLDVQKIAKLASAFILLTCMFENIAVIVLRETRVQWYKPQYKSPFYPWVQMLGILAMIFLLLSMKFLVLLSFISISVPGLILYILYSRKKTNRKGVVGIHGARKDLVMEPGFSESSGRMSAERATFEMRAKVVVPLFGNEKSPEVLIEMGAALASGELMEVTHFTEIPEQVSLSDIRDDSAHIRSLRRRINALSIKKNTPVAFDALVSHDIVKSIYDITLRLHCAWLVTEWGGKTRGAFTLHNTMGWLKNHLACHLVIFRDAGVRYVRKVLVVAKSDEHDRLIISTADHLARIHEASLTIVKVAGNHLDSSEEEAIHMILKALGKSYCTSPTTTMILKGENTVEAIVSASVDFDLLVIGDTGKQDLKSRFFGNDADKIIEKATCSVVSVQPCPKAPLK